MIRDSINAGADDGVRRRMDVLHVIVGLDAGGAELMLGRLIDGNRDRAGPRHSVVSLTDIGPVGQDLLRAGVAVHALGMRGPAGLPVGLWRLYRLIGAARPDVVQTWMYHADFLGGLAGFARRRPVFWGVRATHVGAEGVTATIWLRRACALLSRWLPKKIIFAAEASRRAHVGIGYDISKLVVIPNGFDAHALANAASRREAARAGLGIAPGTPVFGLVGRFNPVKGIDIFVEAAGRVARANPHTLFLMVGRGLEPANAQLMDWIGRAGIRDRTLLLGERADVPDCLAAMDMFCLSSRSEGFPNAVGEAMGVGLPCIVTDVGDAAMLVADTGIVVPAEDPNALAAGMTRLGALPVSQRLVLGAAAQRRIESQFSVDTARRRFTAAYRAACPAQEKI
jgi:glycosyltransferase involved in cell wall biosynthesis